jgi:hypothetical protein
MAPAADGIPSPPAVHVPVIGSGSARTVWRRQSADGLGESGLTPADVDAFFASAAGVEGTIKS